MVLANPADVIADGAFHRGTLAGTEAAPARGSNGEQGARGRDAGSAAKPAEINLKK